MKPEVPYLILVLLPVVGAFLIKARNAETRSKRIGSVALACGVAGFVPALTPASFKNSEQIQQAWILFGVITILLAVTAVVLAFWTFRVRRRDNGVALIYPVVSLMCGVANLFCGAVIFGGSNLAPTDGTPWTWRSEKYGFELTIPTERWALEPTPDQKYLAEFSCSRPGMITHVEAPYPARSDSEYQETLAYGRKIRDSLPGVLEVQERSGTNQNGYPYWVCWGNSSDSSGPYFFGFSITRAGRKAIVLMFEGQYRTKSEMGRSQESRAFREQAEIILGSVK